MLKKLLAGLSALVLSLGMIALVAGPASAHTGNVSGKVVCEADGTYTITWTYKQTNTPSSGTGSTADVKVITHTPEPSFLTTSSGHVGPVDGQVWINADPAHANSNGQTNIATRTGDWTDTFTQTKVAGSSTTAQVTVQTDWLGWGSGDNDGTVSLDGTCGDTTGNKVNICHHNNGNGYNLINVSIESIIKTHGHDSHPEDIIPTFTYVKNGVTYTYPGKNLSDQSLLNWPDCIAIDSAAAVLVSTPSCQAASFATWTGLTNATGGTLGQSVGSHTGVATATANHKFPAAANVTNSGKTLTLSYTILAATTGSPCWPTNATATVTVTPPTCSAGATATAGATTFVDHVQTSGQLTGPGTEVFVFTALSGHKFAAGTGVSADGSTLTITQQLAGSDTSLCSRLVPQAPVVKDLCGTDNDHYGLPTGPVGVTYTRDGLNIVATLAAVNTFWGTLPTGWVLNGNGTATFAFSNTTWTDVSCYPPVKCTLSGASDTEAGDLAPVQALDGLVFDGPTATGQGRDIYYRVLSGNAQGISAIGYTVLPGSNGFTAQIVIEVDPNTDLSATPGVNHYATITALVSGSGVFTNIENQAIWYTNKIAYGDAGGQGNPITYAALVALMPANTLLSAPSLHLQSASPADAHSVVSSLTSSCGTFDFSLVHVVSSVSHTNQTCNVDKNLVGGVITVGIIDHMSYSITDASLAAVPFDNVTGKTGALAPGTYTVTATADTGYGLDPDASGPVVISAFGGSCSKDIPVAASASSSNQICSAITNHLENGFITVAITTGVDYMITNDADATHTLIPFDSLTGKTAALSPGSYTVHPTAEPGHVLTDPGDISLTIAPYTDFCLQLITHPLVDPSSVQVQLGCNTSGTYTLSSDQVDPTAVGWTVNGSTVSQGTYTVAAPGHYVIDAAPGPGFGFDSFAQTHWVYDFAPPTTCDLKTLALTGTTPGGLGVLAGFVTLFGLALAFAGRRIRKAKRA